MHFMCIMCINICNDKLQKIINIIFVYKCFQLEILVLPIIVAFLIVLKTTFNNIVGLYDLFVNVF